MISFQSEELLITDLHRSMTSLIRRILLVYWSPSSIPDDPSKLTHTDRTLQVDDADLAVGNGCRQQMCLLEDDGTLNRSEASSFFR